MLAGSGCRQPMYLPVFDKTHLHSHTLLALAAVCILSAAGMAGMHTLCTHTLPALALQILLQASRHCTSSMRGIRAPSLALRGLGHLRQANYSANQDWRKAAVLMAFSITCSFWILPSRPMLWQQP